jgi:urease accessory protein
LSLTGIEVGNGRTRTRHGSLRAQQLPGRHGWTRIGLVATEALLLGGDTVELEVTLDHGAHLELFEVAGTVAYHGRGRRAAWQARITLAAGARLRCRGVPFIVADGADVDRRMDLDLEPSATAVLREIVIFGRSGEQGGRLRNRTCLRVSGEPVLLEDQRLDGPTRILPGILGDHRVIDTVTMLGDLQVPVAPPGSASFSLPGGHGAVIRHLGHQAAESPIPDLYASLTRDA